ncbi:MAG TPA: alginate export family protein [Rhodanobacter sp.]|nr:alginate export family protein [Rhodanobacter sp.]
MNMNCRFLYTAGVLAAALSVPVAVSAAEAGNAKVPQAAPLQLEWDARLRHEQVDDDTFARNAEATTLRLRAGLRASFGSAWSALLEGAGVTSAGEHYNSGANGRTQYPAITDPTGARLNQAWLAWHGSSVGATLGRQRILLDNQRWVGNSGWRQVEQTYDAVALQWQPASAWVVRYDWLDRVHRVAGDEALNPLARERRLDTHLLNVMHTVGVQNWTGYAYLHEDRDVPTASTATYGMRWAGSYVEAGPGPGWTMEFARQSDYAGNPASYRVNYWLLEPTWATPALTAKLGWEHLGSDGMHALQTPLATLHAFNGWDDQFNVTPVHGLEDRYLGITGLIDRGSPVGQWVWTVDWHDYRADRGARYGSEWDASLAFPLTTALSGLLKVARYHADGFGRDNAKIWFQLEWRGKRRLTGTP